MVKGLDKSVLLVTKKTFYERYGLDLKNRHFIARMQSDSKIRAQLHKDYEENLQAISQVEDYLSRSGVVWEMDSGVECVSRTDIPLDGRFGLVVSLGGDGTLLAASHLVGNTPVLGINSRPGRSVGYFCRAALDDFPQVLDRVFAGSLTPTRLMRMDVLVNGQAVCPPALNDVLYSAVNPAATTINQLSIDGHEEVQKSAGIWVSTPSGSTGAIASAGGDAMELSDRRMQLIVREPYCGRNMQYRLEHCHFSSGCRITNLTPEAAVYVDGARIVRTLVYGDIVEPVVSNTPLSIYLEP